MTRAAPPSSPAPDAAPSPVRRGRGRREEVYAAGPALSVCTLGAVLADAGVVRGMELDINRRG